MIETMIVPTLNQHDSLRLMLASIDYPIGHLVIINNDCRRVCNVSQPDTVEKMTVLDLPSNLGVASSWNLGIKLTPFSSSWMICSDDVIWRPGALERIRNATDDDSVVVSSEWPHWQWFTIGETVIDNVGLFDEALHPANFEDDDFERRCIHAQIPITYLDANHSHAKHSTVYSPEYAHRKDDTYAENESYFMNKKAANDFTPGQWSLDRRRRNTLD